MTGSANLIINGEQQFFDNNGDPLALGKVYFYVPNTNTPKATWQDAGQASLNTNPVDLDIAGRAVIWGSGAYRQVVKDALGNTIWDQETITINTTVNISGLNLLATGIPAVEITVTTFTTIGYAAAGDRGAGATYTSQGAGSGGPGAVQDLVGTWFQLVIDGPLNVGWFGAKGDNSTDDTVAIQNAINALQTLATAHTASVLYLPTGRYKLTSQGTVNTGAQDDGSGTVPAYNSATAANIAAESPNLQAYCLAIDSTKGAISWLGDGAEKSFLVGAWTTGAALSNPAAIAVTGSSAYVHGNINGLSITGFLIGYFAPSSLIQQNQFTNMQFNTVGIGFLGIASERSLWTEVHFSVVGAPICIGGFWNTRCDNYTIAGGDADKNQFQIVSQNLFLLSDVRSTQIDTYFDTYFFKTLNNTTRKYPSGGSGTPATANPYYGICGHSINLMSRYSRPNNSNTVYQVSHMVCSRPALNVQNGSSLDITTAYLEDVGYFNGYNAGAGTPVGTGGDNDPYYVGRYADLLNPTRLNLSYEYWESVEIQNSAAASCLPFNVQGVTVIGSDLSAVNETTASPTGTSKNPSTWKDYGTETILGAKAWNVDQGTNGSRYGKLFDIGYITVTASHSITTFTLPAPAGAGTAVTYLATIWASANATVENRLTQVYLISWGNNAGAGFTQTDQIGTNAAGGGPNVPVSITVTGPVIATGVVTIDVDATATGATREYIQVFLTRIG